MERALQQTVQSRLDASVGALFWAPISWLFAGSDRCGRRAALMNQFRKGNCCLRKLAIEGLSGFSSSTLHEA